MLLVSPGSFTFSREARTVTSMSMANRAGSGHWWPAIAVVNATVAPANITAIAIFG
jgi:hypothetical protein